MPAMLRRVPGWHQTGRVLLAGSGGRVNWERSRRQHMLVTGNDILVPARAGKYGVGSFNTNNMEITQAIIHTAEKLRSPVMVQMSEGAIKYGGQDLANIVIDLAKRATVPVALHLDHGSSYASALTAIKMGFTSIMI